MTDDHRDHRPLFVVEADRRMTGARADRIVERIQQTIGDDYRVVLLPSGVRGRVVEPQS